MNEPIRILVADDHEVVRHGVRAILERQPNWTVAGEANTGREAVAMALSLKPQIVIMDVSMPELNGLEATRRIVKSLPDVGILILTIHQSEELIRDVLEAGAHGYVLKSDAGRDLVAAVEALCQRRTYFTARVSQLVRDACIRGMSVFHASEPPPAQKLSSREREIVQMVAEGHSSKEIGAQLHLSIHTVDTHRRRIMQKLDVHSVPELVRFAIRHRIVAE
jgi:DNA-binding NarL/FixJ family response regulator